jgi:arginyl-tRNA synthetase
VPAAGDAELGVLQDPDELALIRKLSAYPSLVQGSAAAFEPHRITFYLQELAALLHTFYYKHRILAADVDNADERFVRAEDRPVRLRETLTPAVTGARLVLMRAVQQVLQNGLALLGVSAPERM